MSNILKPIDLTERAIRRAVFAVLDDSDQVRFGALCGLQSDISQGPLSAISGCEHVQ
jgi:hypothetical protein